MKIIPLSGWTACRDAEDKAKLIFFDEAFTTPEKHRLFRGNEVEAFLDLWHSYKREPGDNVRALLTGNRESAVNIYLTYFGVEKKPPLLENRVFLLKDGAIAFEYRFNHEKEKRWTRFFPARVTALSCTGRQRVRKKACFARFRKMPAFISALTSCGLLRFGFQTKLLSALSGACPVGVIFAGRLGETRGRYFSTVHA